MASRVGNMLFTSLIGGGDPETGKTPEDPAEQAVNAFKNLRNVLSKAGATPDEVAMVTVHLKDQAHREAVNVPWVEMFPDADHRPARKAILNERMAGATVLQLEVVAVLKNGAP
jgi:2-iminobutanoate/2-iminopropanoate deaminase